MAGTQDWKIYILENISGDFEGQWVFDSNLYRPNITLTLNRMSTHSTLLLENADKVIVQPEKKVHFNPVQFIWSHIEDTFKEQWEDYIDAGYKLKITTHNSSIEFIGQIATVDAEWMAGVVSSSGGDLYNLAITFDITETV